MDSKLTKTEGRRQPQDPEQLSSRRPNRLFLSETIPPSTQQQAQASQSRSHNLSDRIHEYYEKLVKTSPVKKISTSHSARHFPASNFQNRFEAVPKFGEQLHPSVPGRTVLQPANTNTRQSYTVFVEDPTGAFQQYIENTPSTDVNESPFNINIGHKANTSSVATNLRGLMERKKPPPTGSRVQCSLCHSSNHSSQNCALQSRVPAEHDGYPSDPVRIGDSPPTRHSVLGNENQGDGSEERITSVLSFPKKRTIPANINVSCERDVIGQEKSPVSKSHPTSSTALSTSSSNGDTVPRERKKWVRPPLVGQASSSSEKSPFMSPAVFDCLDDPNPVDRRKKTAELQLSSSTGSDQPDSREHLKGVSHQKSSYFESSSKSNSGLTKSDDFYSCVDRDTSSSTVAQQLTSEGEQGLSDSCPGGRVSPSSSVTSNRRLEWDSGADVGYNQMYGSATPDASSSGLCTIERMALAQGCSVALHLRLDPEGTTVPSSSSGLAAPILPSPVQDKQVQNLMGKPAAESTPVDQLPHAVKALRKHRHNTKAEISPIVQGNKKSDAKQENQKTSSVEEKEDTKNQANDQQRSKNSADTTGSSTTPYHRQLSNSMQDLRNCVFKQSEMQKSHSDPDVSGETPLLSRPDSKLLKEMSKSRNIVDTLMATHSISSGSDATLVRVGTEEDLAIDVRENEYESNPLKMSKENVSSSGGHTTSSSTQPNQSKEELAPSENSLKGQAMSMKANSFQPPADTRVKSVSEQNQNKPSGNMHVCSDSDHSRGLHHHFGVLCSTVLGGHIQSSVHPNTGSQPENIISGPDRIFVTSRNQGNQRKPGSLQSPPNENSEFLVGESTGSSAFHSDVGQEENVPCVSTLTGRANSFEYLPGHVYEKKSSSGLRKQERPPGISTSTETDSEPVRPMSRVAHRKVIDSSSHDTEDERLWGSPRVGSNTLVQDLERGVNLLKGVMENKSAGRRCKRELVRRIIKKLVTSEYVEDMIEKERTRHQTHSPFSPRKTKYQERLERNTRSKRYVGSERQDISGESDEPKRAHNVRRKLPIYQSTHHSQGPRTLSTLASGSKSSSLWSSNADSTSGSISLSGSSENQKESKTSVKTNPLYEQPQEKTVDWLRPATQSEKLFEMRKNGTSHAEKHLASLIGMPPQEAVMNPIAFKNNTEKQLSWVTNEINNLKILKQLLQKQESLKQGLNPNFCQTNLTTMPVTGVKQTMQMADCTSPDIPESHSPKIKPSRMRQWISLESDTSAGFGLSNNTASSRDSHWQEVEVASPGEQDNLPHRTVSISDGDEVTDASCSLSNRKSDGSHKSGPQVTHKPRRRSVSISDTDQHFGPSSAVDFAVQKKRSDCHCGKPDARGVRPPRVGTYGPPPRNLSSDKLSQQVCESCTSHSHVAKMHPVLPAGNSQRIMPNRGVSSLGATRTNFGLQSEPQGAKCSCGPAKVQTQSCCCSSSDVIPHQTTGAVKKGTSGMSQQMVPKVSAEVSSRSNKSLPGGGLVRVHIETDQEPESQQSSVLKERVNIAEVSDDQFSLGHNTSDDSITRAVRQAVSSKVKALKNIGQIEEAEVKIRVKVAQGQVSEDAVSHHGRGRVLKSQDLEDENVLHPSKHTDMDDLITKQMAMDLETRQKLLAIAESRQRAQMGLQDVDRRIQDLLLQDYLSRQFKPPESTSAPHARLNVRVEAPVMQGSSVGVQSDVDKKTTGTSTSAYLPQSPPQRDDQSYTVPSPLYQQSPHGACVCGTKSISSARQPQCIVSQGQQTDAVIRPQTAPASCLCSCQSQFATSPQPFSSLERQMEFELDLRKKQPTKPYQMTPHEVHQTLKSRNTAYFLQFEEDPSLSPEVEPKAEVTSKPQMEVVTVKIPKPKPGSKLPSYRPSTAQIGKKSTKGKGSPNNIGPRIHFGARNQGGSSQSGYENANQGVLSEQLGTSNLLRTTPGRSHISVTITDSSADSMQSPDGDSMYSSLQHPSRKPQQSPHSKRKKEKFEICGDIREGEGSSANAFSNEEGKNPSTAQSSASLNSPKQNSNLPANDNESMRDYLEENSNSVPTLQEYLMKNHPKYLDAAEKRRRCIAEMSYLRNLRQQSRRRLLELEGDNMCANQKQQWRARCISRPRPVLKKRPVMRVSKSACARKYMFLPERQQRLLEIKKMEEKRTNRLMAELYTRKLQEKVLKGTATIRSSVSVLSGL